MEYKKTVTRDGKKYDIALKLSQEQIERLATAQLDYQAARVGVDDFEANLIAKANGIMRTRSTFDAAGEERFNKAVARWDAGEAGMLAKFGQDREKAVKKIRAAIAALIAKESLSL